MYEDEYENKDAIPAAVRHLYVESGGKYVLIAAGAMKTVEDVQRVQEGLRKEREDHKETKGKLGKFGALDADEVLTKLDRIAELELAAEGKLDETKISEMVETRLRAKTAPLERQIEQLKTDNGELTGKVGEFEVKDKRRVVGDHIRTAAGTAKLRDTAMDDALLLGQSIFELNESGQVVTRDNVGVTPGITPDVWFTEVKQTRPHWWPESAGAGARGGDGGSGGNNPFSKANWNMTEQGKLITSNRAQAEQMAKSAGTTIGGAMPDK